MLEPEFTPIQIEMWNCPAKRQIDIAAQRSGKTFEILLEHIDLAIRQPYSQSWYVGPTYPLMQLLSDQLTGVLSSMNVLASHRAADRVWTTTRGGQIQFRSADDPEKLKGWDCDLVTLDEASLCGELAYYNCDIATSVKDGKLRISSNVPEPDNPGYHWVIAVYHKWAQAEGCVARNFAAWENVAVYPGGRIDPKIKQLERDLPPDVFARRIGGNLRVLTGLVYPEFDPVRHVIDDIKPTKCCVSVDPAYSSIASIHFYDFDGHRLTAFDEVYRSHLTDPEIVGLVAGYPIRPEFVVYDAEDPGLGALFEQAGIDALPADKRLVHAGIMTTKTWFHQGRIRICERCEKLRWELQRYAFHKRSETPIKVNDHACDDLRYLVTLLDTSEQRQRKASEDLHISIPVGRIEIGDERNVWA
jgi:hypothetical protein